MFAQSSHTTDAIHIAAIEPFSGYVWGHINAARGLMTEEQQLCEAAAHIMGAVNQSRRYVGTDFTVCVKDDATVCLHLYEVDADLCIHDRRDPQTIAAVRAGRYMWSVRMVRTR